MQEINTGVVCFNSYISSQQQQQ